MIGPLVSVIIPVHNGENFLMQAVNSARAQDYSPLEIVVVDDGSTDATARIVSAEPDLRCIRQPHSGLATALNSGVAHATGEWLAFLDHDDLWTPEKLRVQGQALLDDPELDAVFGATEQFLEDPALAQTYQLDEDRRKMNAPIVGAMLIRRAAFFRIGTFDPMFRLVATLDWQSRRIADPTHRAIFLDTVVYRRRIHGANLSLVEKDQLRADYVDMVRRSLQRRAVTKEG